MVVVSQIKDQALGKKTVDKLLFTMAKPKVRSTKLQKVEHRLTAFPNGQKSDIPKCFYYKMMKSEL